MNGPIDIERIVKDSLQKAEQHTHAPAPTPLLIDCDDWDEADIAPRPWVAPGMLLRGAVTVVVGEPAAGKSMLMVGWATSLVLGREYGRMKPVKPCTVLTYNTEDDRDEQRRRFSAQFRSVGCTPADMNGRLFRVSTESIGTLLSSPRDTGMSETPAMQQLEALIKEHRPDVIMLDPLVELHEQEENDNTGIKAVMAHFRSLAMRYEMAVVLLHHTRKGSAGIAGNPDIARGASAITGSARIMLTVSVMTEQEADGFSIPADHRSYFSRVEHAKINAGPKAREEWFERQSYNLDNGDSTAAMLPWAPPEDSVTLTQKIDLEAGIAKGSSEGPWSPKLSNDTRSVRRLFIEHGITSARAQKMALDHLLASGCTVETFRRLSRGTGQGLRTADGNPSNVTWLHAEDAS